MGKEQKYNDVAKCKVIEHLLKFVAMKKSKSQQKTVMSLMNPSSNNTLGSVGKQRKRENPLCSSEAAVPSIVSARNKINGGRICQNSACRAILGFADSFCKRCSCCICHKFDDNKDPSVWLICSSESANEDDSCGLSCHIECALKHGKAGVVKDGQQHLQLDGCYCCPSCGRVSSILGCWKKQLNLAKDARRVDILCYRISMSKRLLDGTEQLKPLHEIVQRAAYMLEEEVGEINGESSKMARGIVSRLSCGLEVQRLCHVALEEAESLISKRNDTLLIENSSSVWSIQFEDVSSTSLLVLLKETNSSVPNNVSGFKLWHRKSREESYPADPTCILPKTQKRALISSLQPCTEYAFKIVAFADKGDVGHTEAACFTKSSDTFQKYNEVCMSKVDLNLGNVNMEDFNCNVDLEGEEDEGNAGFKVRDLGKIFREAWAHEHVDNGSFDCRDKILLSNHNSDVPERGDDIDLEKRFTSSEDEPNNVASSPMEASKDDQIGCTLVQVADLEDNIVESFSTLDEERLMAGIGLMKMSRARQRPRKDPTKSTIRLLKKNNDNFKVTNPKCLTSKNGLPHNSMEMVPGDDSFHDFPPVNSSKIESGKLRNGYSHSNGTDSERLIFKPHREVPAVECPNGNSKKRAFNACDGSESVMGLQNGGHFASTDMPVCLEKNFEHSIKVIRKLECEGHITEDFRKKFLTWFSLRASAEERRIVYAFIDNLVGDPDGLAEQLIDSFSEIISNKRPPVLPKGFCTRLWH